MIDRLSSAARALADRLRALDPVEIWARATEREVQVDPFQRDPEFLARLLPWMETLGSYFGADVAGFEHVPAEGPVLLVGNHSGGILTPDTSVVFAAWYRRFGLDRPLVALAFDGAFGIPGFRTLMRMIGEVPASRANASRALDEGHAVLVYPGGDHEAFRPWRDRNRVDFDGRRGFVELALRHRVPVVPVVSHGGHDSTIILSRGEWLGAVVGMGRIRTRAFPIGLLVPWGLAPATMPALPLPAKISVRVLPPMAWDALPPDAAQDPGVVRRCYDEITGTMQATLDALAAEHPFPVLSRVRDALGAAFTYPARDGAPGDTA